MTIKTEHIYTFLPFFSSIFNFELSRIFNEDFSKSLFSSFQENILPLFRQYPKGYYSENDDFRLFFLCISIIIVIVILILEYFYEEIITNRQREILIDKYRSIVDPIFLFARVLKNSFINVITGLDDIVVANTIWWTNIIVALLHSYSVLYEVKLLIIDYGVYIILILFSIFALLCYDPEKKDSSKRL